MSGTPFYLYFEILFPILIFAAQWFLYKQVVRFVKSFPSSPSWAAKSLLYLFASFNVLFLPLLLFTSSLMASQNVHYCIVFPVYGVAGCNIFPLLVLSIIRIFGCRLMQCCMLGKNISNHQKHSLYVKLTPPFEN